MLRGISEFGLTLSQLLDRTPGAIGAVLCDGEGDAIDFAHRPAQITELDIQIAGAQVGQAIERIKGNAMLFGLGRFPRCLVECAGGMLIAAPVGSEYIFCAVLSRRANVGKAMQSFEVTQQALIGLLA